MVETIDEASASSSSLIVDIRKKLILVCGDKGMAGGLVKNCVYFFELVSIENVIGNFNTSLLECIEGFSTHGPRLVIEKHKILPMIVNLVGGSPC